MKEYTLGEVREVRDRIKGLGDLRAEGHKLWAEGEKLRAEGSKLQAESDKLWAEGSKLQAEGSKLQAEGHKLWAENNIRLFELLIEICPEAHCRGWRGYLAVPKSGKVDWIIPVFGGEYEERKHSAYSIWSMPRRSCNSQDAVLVEESKKD